MELVAMAIYYCGSLIYTRFISYLLQILSTSGNHLDTATPPQNPASHRLVTSPHAPDHALQLARSTPKLSPHRRMGSSQQKQYRREFPIAITSKATSDETGSYLT